MIDNSGKADFIRSDGVQFVGKVQVSGSALVATLDAYTNFFGGAFTDGSTYGVGTFNGTVTAGSSITGSLQFTTSDGTAVTSNWSLTFQTLYNSGSSLATIGGNYTDSITGTVVSISSSGVLFGQNSSNGCVLNGSISIDDASYDVYQVTYTYESCTGTARSLNGISLTGLAFFDGNLSPPQFSMGVTGVSGSTNYGVASDLFLD
jgi:hypothetical protein